MNLKNASLIVRSVVIVVMLVDAVLWIVYVAFWPGVAWLAAAVVMAWLPLPTDDAWSDRVDRRRRS